MLDSSLDKELICFSKLLKGPGKCGSFRLREGAHHRRRLAYSRKMPQALKQAKYQCRRPRRPALIHHHSLTAPLNKASRTLSSSRRSGDVSLALALRGQSQRYFWRKPTDPTTVWLLYKPGSWRKLRGAPPTHPTCLPPSAFQVSSSQDWRDVTSPNSASQLLHDTLGHGAPSTHHTPLKSRANATSTMDSGVPSSTTIRWKSSGIFMCITFIYMLIPILIDMENYAFIPISPIPAQQCFLYL